MFKRKTEYLLEVDVDVHYPFERLRAESKTFASWAENKQREAMAAVLVESFADAVREELTRHGQKFGTVQDDFRGFDEEFAKFRVFFKGDLDGAQAAANACVARVEQLGGVSKIRQFSLRGSDGTNLEWFNREIEEARANPDPEARANLDPETRALINQSFNEFDERKRQRR
jgi:hypothetical protein